VIYIVEHIDPG